jgi:glycosyltransferase involved in cell wall biosynthesis
MRILHVLNDITDRGNGIVNTAVDIAIEQARLGHTVAVVSAGGGHEPLLRKGGVEHFQLNDVRRLSKIASSFAIFRRYVNEFKPDVVHAHMRAGLLLAWLLAKFQHYALVAHLQNVHDRESVLMGLAQRVFVVSKSVGDTMRGMGVPRKKIRVVLNRTLYSTRLPLLSDIRPARLRRPSIVTVCGMYHRKGIAELIYAFERIAPKFPEANLYLVGDGPHRPIFEAQANASAFRERIHFEGFQGSQQSYMLAADVFVLASRRESFGLVLIEARQAGCSIVASNVDGIPEALDGGRAGALVEPQNISALSEALNRMLEHPEERFHWSERAKQGIEAFGVGVMVQEIMAVYQELIAAPQILKTSSTFQSSLDRSH